MAEQLGEKTEDPTAKKYADARERGQVAKSADLAAFVVMGGATISCLPALPHRVLAAINAARS